jgi:nucleoside-diphosphate-sugar epimerase
LPRKGDIKDSLADISLANSRLGFNPDFTIDEGLRETIRWFQKN